VVVPSFARTYNDSDQLKAAIQCLQQQTRLPDYLIVIDDCSPIACTIPSTLTFKVALSKAQFLPFPLSPTRTWQLAVQHYLNSYERGLAPVRSQWLSSRTRLHVSS